MVNQKALDNETMTRFLLGLLSEDERENVETAFFQSDDCFEQLTLFEDELIDDYARGRLPSRFRTAFEEKLASDPRWKQRLIFAQALARQVSKPGMRSPEPLRSGSPLEFLANLLAIRRPSFRIAFASAGVFTFSVALWLGWLVRQQGLQIENLKAERDSLQNTASNLQTEVDGLEQRSLELTRQLEQQPKSGTSPTAQTASSLPRLVASVVLTPGLVRGNNDVAQISVPRGPGTVHLELDLATVGEYSRYRAELRNPAGEVIWTNDSLRTQTTTWGKAVALDVPADRLQSGEHELTLQGLNNQGEPDDTVFFYFNVTKG